ncbi:MAG TPA: 4'-phosphopantetheinyl transferase superfamily protein [Paludibacter sp.]|nr:4'-phosphopantetheinyl transferase superfamily protein [Paludibacter sp.]
MEEIKKTAIDSGNTRILVLGLPVISEDTSFLPENERLHFSDINSGKRKQEFLAVRKALLELLGRYPGLEYDCNGKPFLSDKSYHISISHSKSHVATIIDPDREVGIDIEGRTDKFLRLYKRFLGETEQAAFGESLPKLQIAWSAKEALYKIIGIEAVDFTNQLQVMPFEISGEGTIEARHIPTNRLYRVNYKQTETFTLAYCIS